MTRDIKTAAPRSQVYVRCLTRKQGATATELKQAVIDAELPRRALKKNVATFNQFTSHNSHSLQKFADTYGFQFIAVDNLKAERTYFFRSDRNAEFFDSMIAAEKVELRNAEKAKQAEKLAKQAAKAERDARKAEKALQASKADKPAKASKQATESVSASV